MSLGFEFRSGLGNCLYDITCPVVLVSAEDLDSISDGMTIRIDSSGTVAF